MYADNMEMVDVHTDEYTDVKDTKTKDVSIDKPIDVDKSNRGRDEYRGDDGWCGDGADRAGACIMHNGLVLLGYRTSCKSLNKETRGSREKLKIIN